MKVNILVINCGSSSLNYKLYAYTTANALSLLASGKAHRVGVTGSEPSFIEHHDRDQIWRQEVRIANHRQAVVLILDFIASQDWAIDFIGHRFVHGGSLFQSSQLLDAATLEKIQACLSLAPIHNPNSFSVIQECGRRLPEAGQYVSFDTAFHVTLPAWASTLALPAALRQYFGLRKYGFHGLSYQFVLHEIAEEFIRQGDRQLVTLKLVACHLGTGGSSAVAINAGQAIDTSMSFSPVAGLVMSTRCGDLDPMLPPYWMLHHQVTAESVSDDLNKKSGLLGLSGFSSDLRDIIQASEERNDPQASLAFDLYCDAIRKRIAAYALEMGGLDGVIFTDDIGVQNWRVRASVCQGLSWLGIALDPEHNQMAPSDRLTDLSNAGARVRVFSLPTDEELVIAREGIRLIKEAKLAAL
jgi:acetate kinase